MSRRPLTRWLFGKLPARGDFLSRGLDFAMRDAIDQWLSADIAAARARFGAAFDTRWQAAPPWCFVDADDLGQWSGGGLCASVDAAGRAFPLVIAVPANDPGEAAAAAGGCVEALHAALGTGWSADDLQVAPITPVALGWQPAAPAWALIGEAGPPLVAPGRFPRGVVSRMLEVAA